MKPETGTPLLDGRYIVYVPGLLEWLEPKLVLWTGGKWTFTYSPEPYPDKVHCWIGPLPIMKARAPGWELADEIDEQILSALRDYDL